MNCAPIGFMDNIPAFESINFLTTLPLAVVLSFQTSGFGISVHYNGTTTMANTTTDCEMHIQNGFSVCKVSFQCSWDSDREDGNRENVFWDNILKLMPNIMDEPPTSSFLLEIGGSSDRMGISHCIGFDLEESLIVLVNSRWICMVWLAVVLTWEQLIL